MTIGLGTEQSTADEGLLVSVILPTYNGSRRIGPAIRSVLQQEGDVPFELLVVDDGSTDDTAGVVVRTFDDSRVRVLRIEVNGGTYAAQNVGIRSARGQYVAFIGDDDEWAPTKMKRQVDVLEGDLGVALVHTGMIDVFATGSRRVRRVPRGANSYRTNLWHDCICSATVLIRREVLDAFGGFDESMRAFGDWDLWTRVLDHHRVTSIDEPLAIIHLRPGSLQRGSLDSFAMWYRRALSRRHDELVRLGLSARAEACFHYAVAAKLHQNGDNLAARRSARRSLRWDLNPEAVALVALTLLPPTLAFRGRLALRSVRSVIRV